MYLQGHIIGICWKSPSLPTWGGGVSADVGETNIKEEGKKRKDVKRKRKNKERITKGKI
jgi:hypothetical protein